MGQDPERHVQEEEIARLKKLLLIVNAKPGEVVEVEWRDSFSSTVWQAREEILAMHDADEVRCSTVGYIVKADKNFVTFSQSFAKHNGEICNTMTVPTPMIYKVRKLKGVTKT